MLEKDILRDLPALQTEDGRLLEFHLWLSVLSLLSHIKEVAPLILLTNQYCLRVAELISREVSYQNLFFTSCRPLPSIQWCIICLSGDLHAKEYI